MQNEIIKGNYKATVKRVADGYGDQTFRVTVLYMAGAHMNGDVLFVKNYDSQSFAMAAARRELAKR